MLLVLVLVLLLLLLLLVMLVLVLVMLVLLYNTFCFGGLSTSTPSGLSVCPSVCRRPPYVDSQVPAHDTPAGAR